MGCVCPNLTAQINPRTPARQERGTVNPGQQIGRTVMGCPIIAGAPPPPKWCGAPLDFGSTQLAQNGDDHYCASSWDPQCKPKPAQQRAEVKKSKPRPCAGSLRTYKNVR